MRRRAMVVLGTVAVGLGAHAALASSPPSAPGWIAYVTDFGSNSTTLINTATNTTFGVAIPVGAQPEGVAITPDGSTAYFTDSGAATGTVTPINVTTSGAGTPITVGQVPVAIAITPDGTTAYVVNGGDDNVTPITVATNTARTPIPVGTAPAGIAITPDGRTAYVSNSFSGSVTPITLATNAALTPITVGSSPREIAITPDGKTAYVTNFSSNSVTPIAIATNTAGTPIQVGTHPIAIAITPDGKTAYVANSGSSSVTPITVAANTAGTPITVGIQPRGIAIAPDGKTAYVAKQTDAVTPIDTATNTAGTPIVPGTNTNPYGIAITPDQAPSAAFTVQAAPAGQASALDGSASFSPIGQIASYRWDFGDGHTATTTTPRTTHTYAGPGVYTIALTVTNTAGTSTTQVFTGQTVSREGGPQAHTTHTVTIKSAGRGGTTPALSNLRVTPRKLSIGGRVVNGHCVKPTKQNDRHKRCRLAIRLKLRYVLNVAANVTFTLKRQDPGRKVNGRCVKPTQHNMRNKRCTRLTPLSGKRSQAGGAGANTFTFNGRISGHTLAPGSYQATATPAGGAPRKVIFQIAG